MVEPKADALVKLVEGLVAEKDALAAKEKELVEALIPEPPAVRRMLVALGLAAEPPPEPGSAA